MGNALTSNFDVAAQITAVFIVVLIAGFFMLRAGKIKKSFVD